MAARWAQLYVLCVLEDCDPLDTRAWKLLVLPTGVLESEWPSGAKIRLGQLKKLGSERCRRPKSNGDIARAAIVIDG